MDLFFEIVRDRYKEARNRYEDAKQMHGVPCVKQTLRNNDRLPEGPPKYSYKNIKEIRGNRSQGVFAMILGISVKTLQAWEANRRRPSPTALRLLELIHDAEFGTLPRDNH